MTIKIPASTTPLTKLIRTLEGQLVVVANIALIVVPILTSALPAQRAALYGVILNGVTVIARSILKAAAARSQPVKYSAGITGTAVVPPSS